MKNNMYILVRILTAQMNVTKISRLQDLFLKKRFLKELGTNRTLLLQLIEHTNGSNNNNNNNSQINSKFNVLTKMLSEKNTVKKINSLLNTYYRYVIKSCNSFELVSQKLDARKFLCCFVMKGFPQFVLSAPAHKLLESRQSYDYDIYTMSTSMINLLSDLLLKKTTSELLTKFIKSINMYSNALNIYLYVDRCRKIDELAKQWYEVEKTREEVQTSKAYSDNDKKNVITILNKSSDKIINLLNIVDKNFNKEYLVNYKKLADKLNTSIRASYWNVLTDELKSQNYDMLFKLIDEIRTQLVMLKLNNEKYKEDLYEHLDTDFIRQKIENGLMTVHELLKYGDYMVSKVSELTSASQDKILHNEWAEIKQDVVSGKLDTFEKVVATMLQFVLDKINYIKDDIYGFAIMKDLLKD